MFYILFLVNFFYLIVISSCCDLPYSKECLNGSVITRQNLCELNCNDFHLSRRLRLAKKRCNVSRRRCPCGAVYVADPKSCVIPPCIFNPSGCQNDVFTCRSGAIVRRNLNLNCKFDACPE